MDRRIWAALPVKALSEAKRRLSDCLLPLERRALVLTLLQWTSDSLRSHLPAEQIVVVSPDPDVLQWARERDLGAQQECGRGLNHAIRQVEREVVRAGGDGFLVVLPDLPLFTADDVQRILDRLKDSRHAVIGMGQRGGTHALAIRPPGWLQFGFGEASYRRHVTAARTAGGSVTIYESPGVFFDIDTPEDLVLALRTRPDLGALMTKATTAPPEPSSNAD